MISAQPNLITQLAASLAMYNVRIPDSNCRVGKSYPPPVSSSEPAQRAEKGAQISGEVGAPTPKSTTTSSSSSISKIIEINGEAGIASRLSPSQVRTFCDCQARWKYEKVDGLPRVGNGNLALGSAVHAALAYNFTQKIDTEKDLPVEDVLQAFDVALAGELVGVELSEDETPEELQRLGRGLLQQFMAEVAPTIMPVAVEKEVVGEISGVRVKGFIDVLDIDGRIHDFKTCSKSPNGIEPEQMFQVATYVELEPSASGEARIHSLVKNKSPKLVQMTRTVGPEDLEAIYTQYPLAQEAMQAGLYMPNRTSMLCSRKNCSYWRECEQEFGGKVPLT